MSTPIVVDITKTVIDVDLGTSPRAFPQGGNTGWGLVKASNTNFDMEWVDLAALFYSQTTANSLFALKTHTHAASDVTSGTFADARISKSSVTQHLPPTVSLNYVAKTANYTTVASDGIIDCTSGTFTVTLLTAVGLDTAVRHIKNSGTGTITVDTTSSRS